MKNAFIAVAALAPVVLAQSPVWGQCGGNGWTGSKSCASGSSCVYSNDWYSQCIPGNNNPTTTARTTARTTTTLSRTPTTTPVIRTTTTTGRGTTTTTGRGTTSTTGGVVVTTTTASVSAGTGVTVSGNPFATVDLFPNPYYASEISTLAIPSLSPALATAAAKVAKVPTFAWLDTYSKIPLMESHLVAIRAANKAGANYAGTFVVYDLPDRDCAAAASNGEYSIANGGVANYKKYIDAIKALVVAYADVKMILIIEPDSLANMVTNRNVAKCSGAESAYFECTNYAIKSLALPNVSMYLDGGHGGWLGWPTNLDLAVTMYAKVYKDAGSPSQLRGLVTNVANYNGWSLSSCPSYTSPNVNCDEKKYVNAFGPKLAAAGWAAKFIVDTGRNGVQPTAQIEQGDWCNLIGTGFGVRPTTNTGDALVDAFVWVKPGGECDGTSDTTAVRYDFHCGLADALKPAPEAGSWFQAYFEQLLKNANPAF